MGVMKRSITSSLVSQDGLTSHSLITTPETEIDITQQGFQTPAAQALMVRHYCPINLALACMDRIHQLAGKVVRVVSLYNIEYPEERNEKLRPAVPITNMSIEEYIWQPFSQTLQTCPELADPDLIKTCFPPEDMAPRTPGTNYLLFLHPTIFVSIDEMLRSYSMEFKMVKRNHGFNHTSSSFFLPDPYLQKHHKFRLRLAYHLASTQHYSGFFLDFKLDAPVSKEEFRSATALEIITNHNLLQSPNSDLSNCQRITNNWYLILEKFGHVPSQAETEDLRQTLCLVLKQIALASFGSQSPKRFRQAILQTFFDQPALTTRVPHPVYAGKILEYNTYYKLPHFP
jgi:hypothetical protein